MNKDEFFISCDEATGKDISVKYTYEQEEIVHPPYYGGAIEAIEVLRYFSFDPGNALKYLARAGKKDISPEKKDLRKALFYLKDYLKSDVVETKTIDVDKFKLFAKGKKYKYIIEIALLFKFGDKDSACKSMIKSLEYTLSKL